jgi:glucans biosynthesis protein
VQQLASDLAKKPFAPPRNDLSERWAGIGYDQYRDIRFRPERAIWRGAPEFRAASTADGMAL